MRKNTVVPGKWKQITTNTVSLTRQKKNPLPQSGLHPGVRNRADLLHGKAVSGAVEQPDFLRLFPPAVYAKQEC